MALRVGIVGAGVMGADHALTLHRFVSGAEVAALADPDRSRREAVAASVPGARLTHDAGALIDDPGVDAVLVASHDSTHADLVLACLRAGKPVLCEKPLAPTVAECRRVVQALDDEGSSSGSPASVAVGFMRRFDPGYAALRTAVEHDELGAPLLVHGVCRTVGSGPGTTTESVVTNSAIHDLDVIPWVLGSPVVEAAWHAPRPCAAADGFADPQLILRRTASGVLCTVEVFLNAGYGYDMRCEVVCETGTLALTEPARVQRDAAMLRGVAYAEDWRPRFAEAYRLELQAWVDLVTSARPARGGPAPGGSARGGTSLASAADGLRASAVAAAVVAAVPADGRLVAVEAPA